MPRPMLTFFFFFFLLNFQSFPLPYTIYTYVDFFSILYHTPTRTSRSNKLCCFIAPPYLIFLFCFLLLWRMLLLFC